ncbi:MAG: septum formation initiator family protein [Ferruginibacter sp.]
MKNFSVFIGVIKNKYLIASIFFLVWMLFFDPKDIGQTYGRIEKLNELQKSEQQLTNQIVETKKELDLLKTSAETIERYARENYYMKKDNEDLFIVKTP